ncbi:MAG: long-chain-fatty-acyl-CoA reductase [Oscillospiraceae bacterium]|nr:long-chain-fatty-acyl-CoA reductase [Oscillospiraceae bacterium]
MQLTDNLEGLINAKPLVPFDDDVLEFFGDLSKQLTKVREYSDVATFGFWCRKAALLKEKSNYNDLDKRLGKGVVFHSTPSNVPVNFAFSLAAGLLAGNANIVRLPGKNFEQVEIIVNAVNELLAGKHKNLAPYINFVKYPPNKELHDKFSAVCDVRVIWGGDNTINELRQSPLKPRATELTFADRYSVAVINADEYINAQDKEKIAQDFYNDTYFTDQNACTSPRIVYWLGSNIDEAKSTFWGKLHTLVKSKYELAPVQSVGKLSALYKAAANMPINYCKSADNYITRAEINNTDENLMEFKYNSGFFFEQSIAELKEILPICGERLQTLTYYGLSNDELAFFFTEHRPKGIDRAVPFGKSMDFSLVWDGHDLISQLSRKVIIS